MGWIRLLVFLQIVQLLNLFWAWWFNCFKVSVHVPDNLGDLWNLLIAKRFSVQVHNFGCLVVWVSYMIFEKLVMVWLWPPALSCWIKANTDGLSRGNPGISVAAGSF